MCVCVFFDLFFLDKIEGTKERIMTCVASHTTQSLLRISSIAKSPLLYIIALKHKQHCLQPFHTQKYFTARKMKTFKK